MKIEWFARPARRRHHAGFTLAEVLVALALGTIVVMAIGAGVVFVTKNWKDQQARLATQQNLREAVETLSREVRLASACLLPTDVTPPNNFQPLDGTHSGTTDTIIVRSNSSCVGQSNGTLTAACQASSACGTGPISLGSVTGFTVGMNAYIYQPGASPSGEYFSVATVNSGTNQLTPVAALTGTYTTAAGVYGIDQRTFTVTTVNGIPSLTIATLSNPTATVMVKGIDQLNVQYILNRSYSNSSCDGTTGGSDPLCWVWHPCPQTGACTGVSLAGDWQLVRNIQITVEARSINQVSPANNADGYLHISEVFNIAPRNFVFPLGRV